MTTTPRWTPAILFEPAGERIRCLLCPHRCELADGDVGLCRVRRRTGPALETATMATSVVHVDPIERKPLYHYRPGTPTLTLAAPGCTFFCSYCINYRISQFGRPAGSEWAADPVDVPALVDRSVTENAVIALSYTEPALAIEMTLALADAGRGRGIDVVWKSNGFLTPEAVDAVAGSLSAVNIDVKAADDDRHRRLTGAGLAPVLDTIRRLRERDVWVEICTPLIPGVSDSHDDLRRISAMIAAVDPRIPWHLLRFTPTFRMADRDPTPPRLLAEAADIGRAAGLRYVYVERALGAAGRTTYCPGCGADVIVRDIWSLGENRLTGGACPACAAPVDGRW